MKKKIIKNLGLNKKLISNLNFENIKGGGQSDATNCTPVAACQPSANDCPPPPTATYCGDIDCVAATGAFCNNFQRN